MELDEPAVAVAVFVHQLRRFRKRIVDLENFSSYRTKDFRNGLDGFDVGEGLIGIKRVANLGELDKDNVTEFLLGMLCDDDDGYTLVDSYPFMLFRIYTVRRKLHGGLLRKRGLTV